MRETRAQTVRPIHKGITEKACATHEWEERERGLTTLGSRCEGTKSLHVLSSLQREENNGLPRNPLLGYGRPYHFTGHSVKNMLFQTKTFTEDEVNFIHKK